MSDHDVCINSCSRIAVFNKKSNHKCSSLSQAAKNCFKSSLLYTSGSSSTNRGQSFLPTSPRTPCAFRNVIMFSNLLYTLLGDCFFTSRRNAENFSKSLRSMSAKYIFGQDSWKYFRAVEYAAYVFGFFVSLVSARNSCTVRPSDLCPFPFPF